MIFGFQFMGYRFQLSIQIRAIVKGLELIFLKVHLLFITELIVSDTFIRRS